ncbi:MAG: aminopeptidase P N-terminal domain-containing protein [Deltaproteobacteria bacterium]|nr:aminopeptidase P N-terminal domain-containing protein [Deltaproteobacteria bacterium]
MIRPEHHASRRRALVSRLGAPALFVGNRIRQRNPANDFPFRQDSTFSWLTGCTVPGAALLLDGDREVLFAPPPSEDDLVWTGRIEPLADLGARLGFSDVRPVAELPAACEALGRVPFALAVPDGDATALAAACTGLDLHYPDRSGPEALLRAIADLRNVKSAEEIAEMEAAARITAEAFRVAMAATVPGETEATVAALVDAVMAARGAAPSFSTISTVHAEVLHNTDRSNRLEAGQLFCLDAGAEVPSGYAADVTRVWPVSGRFDPRQKAAYEAVFEANAAAVAACRPGARYRHVHDTASRVIARFLVDEGLLRCSPDASVETGAHALFFPHGVGHLLGMDVHDLENLGDLAAYAPGRQRSTQFGTRYLRLDLDLVPGMTVTIEPGFYVVPAIFARADFRDRFGALVDFDRAAQWVGFTGIRIEDDVLIESDGPRVITTGIPRSVADVEALVGTGLPASARFRV